MGWRDFVDGGQALAPKPGKRSRVAYRLLQTAGVFTQVCTIVARSWHERAQCATRVVSLRPGVWRARINRRPQIVDRDPDEDADTDARIRRLNQRGDLVEGV